MDEKLSKLSLVTPNPPKEKSTDPDPEEKETDTEEKKAESKELKSAYRLLLTLTPQDVYQLAKEHALWSDELAAFCFTDRRALLGEERWRETLEMILKQCAELESRPTHKFMQMVFGISLVEWGQQILAHKFGASPSLAPDKSDDVDLTGKPNV